MRKSIATLALLGSLALPGAASAQLALDLKTGYALPLGDAFTGGGQMSGALKNVVSATIPIEVAGRWRFTPNLSAGVYFQYDPGWASTFVCISPYSCYAYDTRVGVEVAWALNPEGTFNPWVSLGTGWEWTGLSVTVPEGQAGAGKHTSSLTGWEYVNVQVGTDFNLSERFGLGPWVGFFAGAYSSRSDWTPTGGGSIPSDQRTFHGWVQFGLKGTVYL
jgi:hypothetical protein